MRGPSAGLGAAAPRNAGRPGTLAPIVFVFAAMIHDYRRVRRISPIYRWGVAAILGVVGGTFLLVVTPAGDIATQGVAWLGRSLRPLY